MVGQEFDNDNETEGIRFSFSEQSLCERGEAVRHKLGQATGNIFIILWNNNKH